MTGLLRRPLACERAIQILMERVRLLEDRVRALEDRLRALGG